MKLSPPHSEPNLLAYSFVISLLEQKATISSSPRYRNPHPPLLPSPPTLLEEAHPTEDVVAPQTEETQPAEVVVVDHLIANYAVMMVIMRMPAWILEIMHKGLLVLLLILLKPSTPSVI